MKRIESSLLPRVLTLFAGIICLGIAAPPCGGEVVASPTVIPVAFTRTVDAGKAKPRDTVIAKTMQVVVLPDGHVLPQGTILEGHVVESHPFVLDRTSDAVQTPSTLSIRFDQIAEGGQSLPIQTSVRAMANVFDVEEASTPQYFDETDSLGFRVLIGGDEFFPLEKQVWALNGDLVGYNRSNGVFGPLTANWYVSEYSSFRCDRVDTQQSVAVFSPDACGLYGFGKMYLSANGKGGDGTFTLDSRNHTVKLFAHSAALLEVADSQPKVSVASMK